MRTKRSQLKLLVNSEPGAVIFDTTCLFDASHCEPDDSAIDKFFSKVEDLNKLIPIKPNGQFTVLAGLILLGYVSAVESYFREVIRKVINIDRIAKTACEKENVTFGAALVHKTHEMLAEAILERYSFSSATNVEKALKELVSIKGDLPTAVQDVLGEFSKVCQFRHCIVHRYGRFGTTNAIALGLEKHKHCVEKPIIFNYKTLQTMLLVCHNTVKVVNTFLCSHLLDRAITMNSIAWSGVYRKDKKIFKRYFECFYYSKESPFCTR